MPDPAGPKPHYRGQEEGNGGMAEVMRAASGTGYFRDDSAVVVQFPDPSASMSVTGRTSPLTWTPGAASRA